MPDRCRPMQVDHVVRVALATAPHVVQPPWHVIHVAFDNHIRASEKRIDGGPVHQHAGRTVGRSLLLPAGTELWGWRTGDVDFLRLELDPATLVAAAVEIGRAGAADFRPRAQVDDAILWHLACVLRADAVAGFPGGRLLRDGIEAVIAHHLAVAYAQVPQRRAPAQGALSRPRLRRVEEYIRANLQRDLRLAELAGVAGLSTFHFARGFKAATGTSPHRFVLEERLTTACRLLEAGDLDITRVGQLTGFRSLTGFGAAFRLRWGVSPTRYRRAVQG